MKAMLKDNWVPKWLESKPVGWRHLQPSWNPFENNHRRVMRQREARKRYLDSIKAAKAADEQAK